MSKTTCLSQIIYSSCVCVYLHYMKLVCVIVAVRLAVFILACLMNLIQTIRAFPLLEHINSTANNLQLKNPCSWQLLNCSYKDINSLDFLLIGYTVVGNQSLLCSQHYNTNGGMTIFSPGCKSYFNRQKWTYTEGNYFLTKSVVGMLNLTFMQACLELTSAR